MKWLTRITYIYLALPFVIFCMGWLRLTIAIPIAALVVLILWKLFKQSFPYQFNSHFSRETFYLLLCTGVWVFLSGVGGYAFQNWDHHWRNAVLRDLINYNWPVVYASPESGPIKMLVYYVGYWLPAALAGKIFGWHAANFILFLWTWLGILLVALQLSLKLKTSALKTVLLLVFFSGMDALGTLLVAQEYPSLWPPIQHLEIWSGSLQYSSFTTQLFWVFNQAVPAWLCIVLILESNGLMLDGQERAASTQISPKIFIWSLCFFLAPIASIGLLPYLLLEWFKQTDFKLPFKNLRLDLLFASGIIFLVSCIFFSSNSAAQERGLQSLAAKDFLQFFLLDGGILWLLLAPVKWRDPRWVLTGLLLLGLPFIQFGSGRDFVMRASIAPLISLMVMTGEVIFQNITSRFYRTALAAVLFVGALTPLYEIDRSFYRSIGYYFVLDADQRAQPPLGPVTHLEQGVAPEAEHPNTLTADDIQTLEFMSDKLSKNFIANVRKSLYYQFLSPR